MILHQVLESHDDVRLKAVVVPVATSSNADIPASKRLTMHRARVEAL